MTHDPDLRTTKERVFWFIVAYKRQHDGNSPSMREIGKAAGLASHNTVFYSLNQLEKEGRIRRYRFSSREIEVIGGIWKLEATNASI